MPLAVVLAHSRELGVTLTDVFDITHVEDVGAGVGPHTRTSRSGRTVRTDPYETAAARRRREQRERDRDAEEEEEDLAEMVANGDVETGAGPPPGRAERVALRDLTPLERVNAARVIEPIIGQAAGNPNRFEPEDIRATLGDAEYNSFNQALSVLTRLLTGTNMQAGEDRRRLLNREQPELVRAQPAVEGARRRDFILAAKQALGDIPHLEDGDCASDALAAMESPACLLGNKAAADPVFERRLRDILGRGGIYASVVEYEGNTLVTLEIE